ncbi:MAG: tetratricopeptide repeat protein [Armatimonadota bacterium]|nr:tetratricopeptide repeat protein [Armatimonadota bacterium]
MALRRGDYTKAEALYREALSLAGVSPERFEALAGLGKSLERQGKVAEAFAAYQQSFAPPNESASYSTFPADVEALARYGILCETAGQYAEAARVYEQARERLNPKPTLPLDVDFDPKVPQPEQLRAMLHVVRGLTLDAQGIPNEALADYSEAARLQPDQPLAQFYLGRGLQKAGRTAEARAAFQKAAQYGHGAVQAEAQKALR